MYYVYLLECSDGTLYTGYTKNVEKRLQQHSKGLGAKYTRGRLPVQLKGVRAFKTQTEAMRAEILVKKMKKHEKIGFFSINQS